jgi:hydrogenase maturation protease
MVTEGRLVIGLGNALAGDDGAGSHLAARLRLDPRLPHDTDVLEGGCDLLRLADQMEGRRHVILVDAILSDAEPGTLTRRDGDPGDLGDPPGTAHSLSPVSCLRLLRSLFSGIRAVPVSFITVSVRGARATAELSPEIEAAMPALVDQVLEVLSAGPPPR